MPYNNIDTIIIDMDKVLFNTNKFVFDISKLIESEYKINCKTFINQVPDYYTNIGKNLRFYNFFDHLKNLNIDNSEFEKAIINKLSTNKYIYDDVPDFISFLENYIKPKSIQILTFGENRFQNLKYSCSSEILNINYVDTIENKSIYIKRHFKGKVGIIIDDKPIESLPSNFQQILLARPDCYPESKGFKSLTEISINWSKAVNQI